MEDLECPKCKTKIGGYLDDWYPDDGGEQLIECDECGFKSTIIAHMSWSYDVVCDSCSYRPDPSEKFPDCYKCEYCEDVQFARYKPELLI